MVGIYGLDILSYLKTAYLRQPRKFYQKNKKQVN